MAQSWPRCRRGNGVGRNSWYRVGILAVGAALGGCSAHIDPATFTPTDRARIESVKVYHQERDRAYRSLGTVSGRACLREPVSYVRFSPSTAFAIMRHEAGQKSADAVIGAVCKMEGYDLVANCWLSHVCKGEAIKYVER